MIPGQRARVAALIAAFVPVFGLAPPDALFGAEDSPPPVPAPQAPAPQAPVERVEVRGEAAETALDPTAFATVIRAADFAGRIATLPELLRETAGVQVTSLGGDFSTVSIRGSSAEQVIVYLDGVPLNRALGGGVNLADLPLALVDSITIYRGITPAALPAASIGGAVLITTRRGGGRPAASASADWGSFSTGALRAGVSGGRGGAEYAAGFDLEGSDGDFTFLDNNGTEQDPSDDAVARRTNNDFRREHLTGRYSYRAGTGARVGVSADLMAADRGSPGLEASPSSSARFGSTRSMLRADFERPGLLGGRVLLRGAADALRQGEIFDDPGDDFMFSARRTANRSLVLGQEAGITVVAGRLQALSIFTAHRRESADLEKTVLDSILPARATRDTLTATVEDQIALAGGRLVLNPSVRYESHRNAYDADLVTGFAPPASLNDRMARTSGKAGFLLRVSDRVGLRGNVGTFFRMPDFTDLFGDRGSVHGNPALLPESGRTLDLGVTAALPAAGLLRQGRIEATVFETRADDLIILWGVPQGVVTPFNAGMVRIRGVEIMADLTLGPRFTGSLNFTHQDARDTSDRYTEGRRLPFRPADELTASCSLALGRARLFYIFNYVGPNFTDPSNTDGGRLPARYLHDAGFRVRLRHGLEASLQAKNLADRQVYDVARFPLPGRSLEGRLAWDF